jgi:hypothetical protein
MIILISEQKAFFNLLKDWEFLDFARDDAHIHTFYAMKYRRFGKGTFIAVKYTQKGI